MIDDKTKYDRNDDDLYDRKEHTDHIDIDGLTGIQIRKQRGKERSEHGRYGGHSNRQCHIPF